MRTAQPKASGSQEIGEISPHPTFDEDDRLKDVKELWNVEDIRATILDALRINFKHEVQTPVGRPMASNKSKVTERLVATSV